MTGIQPEPTWHTAHSPQQWTEILHIALQAHRENPQDDEALDAIKQANEALNAYDKPALEAGEHTFAGAGAPGSAARAVTGGWGNPLEAIKGEAEGATNALASLYTVPRDLATKGIAPTIDELVEGVASIPGEIASGDPRRIGRVGGNVAGGIAVGSMAKATGGMVSDLARRPGLKNELIKSQTARTNASTQALTDMAKQRTERAPLQTDILGKRAARLGQQVEAGEQAPTQARLRTDLMQAQAERAPSETVHAAARAKLAEQNLEHRSTMNPLQEKALQDLIEQRGRMGDPTVENIELRNELLRRKLEGEVDEAIAPSEATRVEMPSREETIRQHAAESTSKPKTTGIKSLDDIFADLINKKKNQ